MCWQVKVRAKVQKSLAGFPKADAARIVAAFFEIRENPIAGDIQKMDGERNVWRRRVGNYRIFFELYLEARLVYIYRIERRTSSTY